MGCGDGGEEGRCDKGAERGRAEADFAGSEARYGVADGGLRDREEGLAKKMLESCGKVLYLRKISVMEESKIFARFGILDEVVYLNTATARFERAVVKGIRVVPTGIHKDEGGRDVLDGSVVLYELFDGPVVAQEEVFPDADEAKAYWLHKLGQM